MHDMENIKRFSTLMPSVSSSDTSASELWSRIQKSVYQNVLKSFGKNKPNNNGWFEKSINVLLPLLKIKRQAHVDCQYDTSCTSQKRLHEARKTFENS